ncbi:hypothetical protein [Phenylobacterium sp.]|uniref:hypothetical protein n=1 Tax=Phenylobacterium sp. TaxID=1871053 RepID=UPI002B5B70E5|nr:hypothetical protein [Phenylobacterium sp.]HVI30859.1 hypothetical protein [Phenylobacterium sp.]
MSALRKTVIPAFQDPAEACIDAALARIGAYAADFAWPDLRLMAGEQRVVAGPEDGLGRLSLATTDIDELKAWIGVADEDARAGRAALPPQGPESGPDHATDRDVRRALSAYVFGDSRLMQAWRPVIEQRIGRFDVDVVTVGTLSLHRRSRLILAGRPVVFMARRIVFDGGHFVSTVDGHYAVGEIVKREAR